MFEFDAKLVERDAGLEQLGLEVAQGLAFHPFGGAGMQVACRVEGGVGAETGWCEPDLVGGVDDLGVLAVGDTDGQAFLSAGEHIGATAALGGRVGAHSDRQRRRGRRVARRRTRRTGWDWWCLARGRTSSPLVRSRSRKSCSLAAVPAAAWTRRRRRWRGTSSRCWRVVLFSSAGLGWRWAPWRRPSTRCRP